MIKRFKKIISILLVVLLITGIIPNPMTGSGAVYANVWTTYSFGATIQSGQGVTEATTDGTSTGGFEVSNLNTSALPSAQIWLGGTQIHNATDTTGSNGSWIIKGIPVDISAGTYVITWDQTSKVSPADGPNYHTILTLTVTAPPVTLPSVSTGSHGSVSSTQAYIAGNNVSNNGGDSNVARGVAFGTASNPAAGVSSGTGSGNFDAWLTGLQPNTTYYYRAYATNSAGTSYGNQGSFTTLPNPPSVTISSSSITENSVTMSATVNNNGGTISNKGFSGGLIYNTTGDGNFSNSFTSLIPNTQYSVTAYATNAGGTGNASTSFFTLAALPSLQSATPNGALIELSVNANSNPANTQYYVEASLSASDFSAATVVANWVALTDGKISFNQSLLASRDTNYYFRIKARNGSNIETAYDVSNPAGTPATIKALTLPAQPGAPTLVPSSVSQMIISNYNVPNADSAEITYNIYRNNNLLASGMPTSLITLEDSGLTTNTQYTYKVEAINASGTTVASNNTSAYTLASVPDLMSVEPQANGDLLLTIDKKDNPDITQYLIEQSTSADFTTNLATARAWNTIAGGVSTFTVDASTVNDDTTYYYRIKARNGDLVETAYGVVKDGLTVPPVPGQPAITVNSNTQLTITWPAVVKVDTDPILYDLYVSVNGGSDSLVQGSILVPDPANPAFIHTGLIPNTSYTYYVRSRNASGVTTNSATIEDATFATVPDVSEVLAKADGEVTLTIEEYGNPDITAYYVEKATNPSFTNATLALTWTNPGGNHEVTLTGLDRGTLYYFRVKARNQKNIETAYGSIIGSIRTIPGNIGNAPTATAVSTSQINLSWNSVLGATSYDLYRDGVYVKNIATTTTSDTGLSPNEGNQYTIIARNSSGVSINSSPASAIKYTFTNTPGIQLVARENGTIVDVTIDVNSNGTGAQYFIEYATVANFTGASQVTWSTTTNPTITGLTQGETYYFRVKARNGNNGANSTAESSWSTGSNITTPLTQVTQPTVSPVSDTELGINWGAVANAAQYKVYKDGVYLATVAGTSYTDTGLKANKSYSYEVSAINATGLKNVKSVSASGRTLAAYPESITITDRTKTSIEFIITPSNHIGDPEKYQLILKDKAGNLPNITLAYSTDLVYLLEGIDNTIEYEVWVGIRNNDNASEPAIKMMDSAFANRDVTGVITNNENSTHSEVSGHNTDFILALKVYDPDGDTVTVSATIAGIKREVTILAPKTEPAGANVFLSWDIFSLPEATYSNIIVTLKDPYDSETTAEYTSTLTVDKTKPTITLDGDEAIYLFVGDVYVDADPGAIAANADGNAVVVTGADLVDTETLGVYIITYTVTDNAGNSEATIRNIHVVEPTAITDNTVDNIGATSATFFGEILSLGKTNDATEYGFVYGTSADPTFEPTVDDTKVDLKLIPAAMIGVYSADITGLTVETTYYVRAYILDGDNADEPIYGETVTFDTLALADEKARFSVDQLSYSGVEGTTITVTVNRSIVTIGEMTIDYTLEGITGTAGVDFTAATDTITFAEDEISKTIEVVTIDNALFEPSRTLKIMLSNPSEGSVIINSTALITITDNDVANSNKNIATFNLTGSTGPAIINHGAETITLMVANGTDLTQVVPSELTLEALTSSVTPALDVPRDFTAPVAYTVTAEDGTTKRYIVTISVQPLSSESTLSNLVIENNTTPLTLSPSFASDTYEYSLTVANEINTLTISPTLTDGAASFIIKRNNETEAGAIPLSVGNQVVDVIVTAENGATRTYRINVTRQPAASSNNAFLQSLTLGEAVMTPAFDKNVKNYTLTIENAITGLMVSAAPEDSSSGMVITANGVVINSGSVFNLTIGSNLLRIAVTSTNGTEYVYAVAITRTAAQNTAGGGSSGGSTSTPSPGSGNTTTDTDADKNPQTGQLADDDTTDDLNKKITEQLDEKKDEKVIPKGPIMQFGEPKKEPSKDNDPSVPEAIKPEDFTKKTITLEPKDNPIADDEDLAKYTVGRIDPETGKIIPVTGVITRNKDGSVDVDIFDKGDGYYTLIKNTTEYIMEGQDNHWAKKVAEVVSTKYLLDDILGNDIDLNGDISRAEAAAIMVKLMAVDISRYKLKSGFSDVDDGHTLEAYLSIASRFGIVNGYGDGSFRPNQIVFREEMAVIVYNTISYLRLMNLSLQGKAYQDDGQISRWSYGQVHTLTKLEIFRGTPTSDFLPKKEMSIGEVLQMFFNIDQYLVK